MHTKIEFVTPEIASYWLSKNDNNRKLNERRAAKLAEAMKRGEWQFNGDTIRISQSGQLLDGQHRLRAIQISGMTQEFIIVYGLPDSVFTTIDTGTARTAAQMFQMDGIKHATASAASANLYLTWLKTGKPKFGTFHKTPTQSELYNFVTSDEDFRDSVARASGPRWLNKYATPSVACFCLHAFKMKSPEDAELFFTELAAGEFSYKNSPIKLLREMCIEDKGSSKKRLPIHIKAAYFFKAFNIYLYKNECRVLRLSSDQEEWYKL